MAHRNARLTLYGRRLLIEPVAHLAAELGCSRQTASKWVNRWRVEGDPGLHDRSSVAHRMPHRTPTPTETEQLICRLLRPQTPAGPVGPVGGPATLDRACGVDPPRPAPAGLAGPATGRPVRQVVSYERDRPGDLVHVGTGRHLRYPVAARRRAR